MRKLIILVSSILTFAIYLTYSYNNHSGKSFLYEPIYLSIKGEIPENTRVELLYRTINDPASAKKANRIEHDSIPKNSYIFKIDSSYRLAYFSLYFLSLPEEENFTIKEIKGSTSSKGDYYFLLKSKDIVTSDNLILKKLDASGISLRKMATDEPNSATIYFDMRTSFEDILVRTQTRMPELPSIISFMLIAFLGILMVFCIQPIVRNLKLEEISVGAYTLALVVFILPSGEKICNLLLAISIIAGLAGFRKRELLRAWFTENKRILLIVCTIILIYFIALLFARSAESAGNLIVIKLGLPTALLAVALNSNNKKELHLHYTALLAGIIVSIFIHFGWLIMLIDSVEMKREIISNFRHYIESSIFTRVHHTYLSVLYLVILTTFFFKKDLIPIPSKVRFLYASLIVIALLLAFSRAAILSLALILTFIALKRIFQSLNLEFTYAIRFILAISLTIALLLIVFIDIGANASTEQFAIKGLHTRIALWENAAEIIRQKPITGWGPENYKITLEQSELPSILKNNSERVGNTHNQFLETSGMFGLIVGIGLVWFLVFPTGISRKNPKYTVIALSTAIMFITVFFFESFLNRNLGVLIFGLCYGLLMKMRSDLFKTEHAHKKT